MHLERLDQIQTVRIIDARRVQLVSSGWKLELIVDDRLVGRGHFIDAKTGALRRDYTAELPTELTLVAGQTCRARGHRVQYDYRLEHVQAGRALFKVSHIDRRGRKKNELVAVKPYGLALFLKTDKPRYGRKETPRIQLTYNNVGSTSLLIQIDGASKLCGTRCPDPPPLYTLRWLDVIEVDPAGSARQVRRVKPLPSSKFLTPGYHELPGGASHTENATLYTSFWRFDNSKPLERLKPGRYVLHAEYRQDPLPQATIEAAKRFLRRPKPTAEKFAQAGIRDISLASARWLDARQWRLWAGTIRVRSPVFTIQR